jgi:tetratricopeptide (TPR) repeat protein
MQELNQRSLKSVTPGSTVQSQSRAESICPAYIEQPYRPSVVPVGASQISALLANADILIRNRESELGFTLIRQALTVDSHHALALKKLGQFHMSKKRYAQAEIAFEEVLKADYSFENLAQLAEACYLQNKDEKAAVKYEEAFSIIVTGMENPQILFEAFKNLGNIQCRAGDFQAAQENYFKAFALNPKSDMLLVNLGTLDFQQSELSSSLEKFRQALAVNPRNDRAWVGLAVVHDKMGDSALAMANIENAVEIAPSNRTAVHILSNWAVRDLRYSTAIEVLQEYLGQVEQDEEMSLVLIHLFCLTQQFDLARFEVERVLLWNPEHPEVLRLSKELPKK